MPDIFNSAPALDAESTAVFHRFYTARIAEAGGAHDDLTELQIARDILNAVVKDGLTPTPDGSVSHVRRGAMNWTDEATVRAVQTAASHHINPPVPSQRRGIGLPELFQAVAIFVLILAAIVWFFWPFGPKNSETSPDPSGNNIARADSSSDAETIFVPTPTAIPTLEAAIIEEIVDGGVKTKELVVPRTLEIKGVSFIVQPVNIKVGDWSPPEFERAVSWVHGSVINYVMGVEGNPANRELLASLQPGDQLLLRMSTGATYRFVYMDTVRVAPHASEVFGQTECPTLTLAVLGDETAETRVILRAIYVPDTATTPAGSPVKPASRGKPVTIDDKLRVTWLGSQVVPAPPELAGYAYLGVNTVLENTGSDLPLLTASFAHRLVFGDLLYPTVAAEAGAAPYPPLPETLPPNEPFTTTIIYAAPANILRQEIVWEFSADTAGAGDTVRAVLPPYEGLLTPGVKVIDYQLENGTLVLMLEITAALNNIRLEMADINLAGAAFSPIGNHFPWRVIAGEHRDFVLMLTPDGEGLVGVSLLEHGIEVTY